MTVEAKPLNHKANLPQVCPLLGERLEPFGKGREEFVPPKRDEGRKAERAGASESKQVRASNKLISFGMAHPPFAPLREVPNLVTASRAWSRPVTAF